MSFLARLLGVEGRGFEAAFLAPGAATDSGVTVTPDQAMRLSAVWSCVRLLADTISTLPLDVYRGGELITTPPLLVEPAAGQPRHDWIYSVMVSLLLRGNAFGLITARSGATLLPSQIELVDPDILVCVGRPSSMALLEVKSIMAARGRWLEYDSGNRRIPALPILHPAYLLRSPLDKRLAWRDLRTLKTAIDAL